MKLEIVEIGTSDFRTQAGIVDGLFVEPVPTYFDNLPPCRKENVAVSNVEGSASVYYIPPDVIEREKLPYWVKGCNSINSMHPTLEKYGWKDLVVEETVDVVRIKSLLDKYEVTEITTLKIDTEGHDTVILNDFLDTCDILPEEIIFEDNVLSDEIAVLRLVKRLRGLGYGCIRGRNDCRCLKL